MKTNAGPHFSFSTLDLMKMGDLNIVPSDSISAGRATQRDMSLSNTALPIAKPFPFLLLPAELRLAIYRHIFVVRGEIRLDCFLPASHFYLHKWKYKENKPRCKHPAHRPRINTAVLRLCHQITAEALAVLYGENHFACITLCCLQPVIVQAFSSENLGRVRKLTLEHYWNHLDSPLREAHNKWRIGDHHERSDDWEQFFAGPGSRPVLKASAIAQRPDIWQPIFARLTSLTVALSYYCDFEAHEMTQFFFAFTEHPAYETILKPYQSKVVKHAMSFYDSGLPVGLMVRKEVRCPQHECQVVPEPPKVLTEREERATCDTLCRYVDRVWLHEDESAATELDSLILQVLNGLEL